MLPILKKRRLLYILQGRGKKKRKRKRKFVKIFYILASCFSFFFLGSYLNEGLSLIKDSSLNFAIYSYLCYASAGLHCILEVACCVTGCCSGSTKWMAKINLGVLDMEKPVHKTKLNCERFFYTSIFSNVSPQ